MDVETYLQRIGYEGAREPTEETLRRLHRAHMYAVPFENLDIPLGRTITLSVPAFFEKIVCRRRGGFCYELNALFGWLLSEIGFNLETLSARVYSDGPPGPSSTTCFFFSTSVGATLQTSDSVTPSSSRWP